MKNSSTNRINERLISKDGTLTLGVSVSSIDQGRGQDGWWARGSLGPTCSPQA